MVDTDDNLLRGQLLPGEQVLWQGRPRQGLMTTSRDLYLIPFSLLWGGFAIFWEASVLSRPINAPIPFVLFGGSFVCVGLFLIFGRFLLDAWLRKRMAYALTDKRVLIVRRGPWSKIQAVALDRLPEATLAPQPDGRGTIHFGTGTTTPWGTRNNAGFWIASLDSTPQFLGIENAQQVFHTVQQRLDAARA